MKRRTFLGRLSVGSGAIVSLAATPEQLIHLSENTFEKKNLKEVRADVVITGAGLGGVAAALASLRNGLNVVLTEETDWIGGQLTQQGVPPDEHQWIETHGATKSYRELRTAIREFYQKNYPLTEQAKTRKNLNPGDGGVSRICHEPRVALAVLTNLLMPYISSGKLTLLLEHKVSSADVAGDRVEALKCRNLRSGRDIILSAPYFVDATELGDLLPLTGTEFIVGAESRAQTNELHAPDKANPANQQAFTMCLAMDYDPTGNHVIEKPKEYGFWNSYIPKMTPAWPGRLISLTYSNPVTLEPKSLDFDPVGNTWGWWVYRRIINKNNFVPGIYSGDITIVNWPQNDYLLGNLVGVSEKEFKNHIARAKQLSLSLLYWMQTEVERPDGKRGWPGLRLRGDVLGSEDGLAKYPYIREARRIQAKFTVSEEHVGLENRAQVEGKNNDLRAAEFKDSVGVGSYAIDLHPTSNGQNYIDIPSLPFQIPLGALLPKRVKNLLPACKNIGTTHITNGCYRLHPVEWNIGESVGMLVKFALQKSVPPVGVWENSNLLAEFQDLIRSQGIETHWPE